MTFIRYTAVIKIRGINPYIAISAARAKTIKPHWRKPMPVLVRINGKPERPWHINMMPAGDSGFYLYLHGVVRKASGTQVGDRVQVEVGFDEKYRNGPMLPMPTWFKRALNKNRTAVANWQALIPSRKKEMVRHLARLKSPEARERNLRQALHVLSGNKGRFMARSWNE
jgi:hypothetical protein